MRNKYVARIKTIILSCLLVFIMYATGWAVEYFVDGSRGNDANPGSLSSPWKTIGKANSTLKAGDTVFIRTGIYNESIRPSNNGTTDNRITYTNYMNEEVTISGVSYSINLTGRSYITIDGIDATNATKWVQIYNNSNHNWIQNCTFTNLRNDNGWPLGMHIYSNSKYNKIQNVTAGNCGHGENGAVLEIGTNDNTDTSHYNLIENCKLFNGGHYVMMFFCGRVILKNNLIYHAEWKNGYGDRCISSLSAPGYGDHIVVEGNIFSYSGLPVDQVYSAHAQMNSDHCIVRNNSFYNANGVGWNVASWTTGFTSDDHRIYNNTFYHNGYRSGFSQTSHGITFMSFNEIVQGAVVVNNIFEDNKGGSIKYVQGADSPSNHSIRLNWWDTNSDPEFVNKTIPSDPADITALDLSLKLNSPCIDSGEFLTTITSSSGSGASFQVADAKFFIDGWGIVEGDSIQLEGQKNQLKIVNINYDNNQITVDQTINWNRGDGVSLPYNGSSPDLGAFESGAGPINDYQELKPPHNLRIIN